MKKIYTILLLLLCFAVNTRAQLAVFTDNYASGVSFVPFGGSTNSLSVDNTQSHSGSASLKIPVTAGYTGGALVLAAPADLSAYTAVTFWAKNDNPAFKLDGVGLGNNAATTKYAAERNGVTLTAGWVKYYIPIPDPAKLAAETGLFHFAEGAGEGTYNIWIDDIQYENVSSVILGTPTAALATETISKATGETFNPNGTVSVFPVCAEGAMQTARAYFTWASSNTAIATINADGVGTAVAQGTSNITARLRTIDAAGVLTVNVTAALQEPSIAAPAPPARNAADVISVFSGAYADIAGTDFNPNWGQSTIVTEVNIAGNPTKKYASFNYQGVQFAAAINASQMEKLHIDIWTPNCTAFDVYPIVSGQPEQFVTLTPTLSGWNSFDIDLSQYSIPLNAIIQFKFVGTPFGSSTVYYDNLYFYKTGSAPTAPATAAPLPTENSADVISLFSNAYTNVPVDTWSASWDNADVADVQVAGNDNKLYSNLVFAGVEFTSATINATGMDFLHVDIWTPNATNFNIKLVDFGANNAFAGGDDTESELTYTPAQGAWVSYDINLNSFTGLASRANLAQMLFISSGSTVYVDNVYFYKVAATAPATAAPAPTQSAANVISLFSNAYTNEAVDTWSASWDNADVADVQVAGNDTKLYTNLNFAGVEFTSNTTDATEMNFLHLDIWTPNSTFFRVKLVDFGANNTFAGGDDTESELSFTPSLGSWVSYDINLNDFTGLASRANLAQMLFIGSGSTVYIDNIYFYKTSPTPVRLSQFSANVLGSTVLLKWATEYEANNKGFSIERSTDASIWQQVAFVNGTNSGSVSKQYSLTDFAPARGVNFYRIKQVDYDGRITYSPVQRIVFNKNSGITVFPNPAKDRINIAAEFEDGSRYNIMRPDGKIVQTGLLTGSNNWQSIDVSLLPGGTYFLRIVNNNEAETAKFIIY
jgi:hypothetical protein